jgi:hypothetical protein
LSFSRIGGFRVAGIATCVPPLVVDNLACGAQYGEVEVRKVVAMAGVKRRHVVDAGVTAADLCFVAAKDLLARLNWSPESITGLIFVTQSPDYWLPSTSCVLHKLLGLPPSCAAFDVGLGCSGYPYGLYLAASSAFCSCTARRLPNLHPLKTMRPPYCSVTQAQLPRLRWMRRRRTQYLAYLQMAWVFKT